MAKVVFASYMIRYPLGGMMSYVLQYLVGLKRLGHEVVFVERASSPNECFDPASGTMTDDPAEGLRRVSRLFRRHGLDDGLAFVDVNGRYYGMSDGQVARHFASSDVFIDMGTHGAWNRLARTSAVRILIDGEPGFNQIRWSKRVAAGDAPPSYDLYYTNGLNVGTAYSSAPTAGVPWRHLVHPVVTELFEVHPAPHGARYTTVMNWQSHEAITYRGTSYGQKDIEFERFMALPRQSAAHYEVAVAGRDVPRGALVASGWSVADAHLVTASYDSYHRYLSMSRGEFAVCKNVFVALNTGWFSDRSAAYLAYGRPVVMQDTGFSRHLPVGEGLFAVRSLDEAVAAVDEVEKDYERHSRGARALAEEYFATAPVLGAVLREAGV